MGTHHSLGICSNSFLTPHRDFSCIGGVGVFLIQTGLNVSAGMGEEEADLTWRLLKLYFTDTHVLSLWIPAFVLAVLLRIITHKYHHQLIFPMCEYYLPVIPVRTHHPILIDFVALPIIFYIIVFIAGFDVDTLRAKGWVFDVGESREPWYKFYSYFGKLGFVNLQRSLLKRSHQPPASQIFTKRV